MTLPIDLSTSEGRSLATEGFHNLSSSEETFTNPNSKEVSFNPLVESSSASSVKSSELCLTWWVMKMRFFYNCTVGHQELISEGYGPDILHCIDNIQKENSLDPRITINVLRLREKRHCGDLYDITAEVCLMLFTRDTSNNQQLSGYPIEMQVYSQQPHLVYLDTDTLIDNDISISDVYSGLIFTTRSSDECVMLVSLLSKRLLRRFSYDFMLPTLISNCALQEHGHGFQGDHCVEHLHVVKGAVVSEHNCSFAPSLKNKGLLSERYCKALHVKTFCLIESVELDNSMEINFRLCSSIFYLTSTKDNIHEWKEDVKERCYFANQDMTLKNSSLRIESTLDIDETNPTELDCLMYSGYSIYLSDIQMFASISSHFHLILSISAITLNIISLKINFLNSADQQVTLYLSALSISNMLMATKTVIEYITGSLSLFNPIFSITFVVIHLTSSDFNLLIVLALSVERTIAVYKPMLKAIWCTSSRAKKVSLQIIIIFLV